MRPIQFTGDGVIRQSPRVRLHLSDDGPIGNEKLWRCRCVTDEVAEVDTGYKRVTISAGEWCRAAFSKVGLQPFENFPLSFHGQLDLE